jgi:CMP/dCMP kinase
LGAPPLPDISIALDGFAGCGKSTLARDLGQALGYSVIDTGAMYRAVTWRMMHDGLDPKDSLPWESLLDGWPFSFEVGKGAFRITFSGRLLGPELRSREVTAQVSRVSAIPMVRTWLVRRQQALARVGGIILEGRDIGTVVLPGAELRLFITASLEERARRRFLELQGQGGGESLQEVRASLERRDHYDCTRADSPLQPAPGVLWLDTTRLSREGQLRIVLDQVSCLRQAKVIRKTYV